MTTLPPARRIATPTATGEIHPHGAHVTSWKPNSQEPVLWMSEHSNFDDGLAIRGGVPICLPWFGAGRSGDLSPVHGFARVSQWSEGPTTEGPEGVTAEYTLDARDAATGSFVAHYAATFGSELDLRLTVTNTGDRELSFEEALHTYLVVGDARRVIVRGLDGADYLDRAPGGASGSTTQHGDITITAETDRVYLSTTDVVVVDPVFGRELIVRKTGSADTVVWNPWVAKSAAMPDFGDDEWTGMLCIEAANVLDDAVVLQPGASHTLGYHLSVRPL